MCESLDGWGSGIEAMRSTRRPVPRGLGEQQPGCWGISIDHRGPTISLLLLSAFFISRLLLTDRLLDCWAAGPVTSGTLHLVWIHRSGELHSAPTLSHTSAFTTTRTGAGRLAFRCPELICLIGGGRGEHRINHHIFCKRRARRSSS